MNNSAKVYWQRYLNFITEFLDEQSLQNEGTEKSSNKFDVDIYLNKSCGYIYKNIQPSEFNNTELKQLACKLYDIIIPWFLLIFANFLAILWVMIDWSHANLTMRMMNHRRSTTSFRKVRTRSADQDLVQRNCRFLTIQKEQVWRSKKISVRE